MLFQDTFRSRRVAVTGHTGFKGSWLCEWLLELGAELSGLSLEQCDSELLFKQLRLSTRMLKDVRGNILEDNVIREFLDDTAPEIVFHLAAQPLVRQSYMQPRETFSTNVMGTVNLLEALRGRNVPCVVVCITTDKCYENQEWGHAYRESDKLGGYDPYSASKACSEIAISAYRNSFFSESQTIRLASARAGNVIGGGDWAPDRIVPDCFRCLNNGREIVIRNKNSTRPWQHVLEPLSGYLLLAAEMWRAAEANRVNQVCSAFNFGPVVSSNRTVQELVEEILKQTEGRWREQVVSGSFHEAVKLNLAIDKAFHVLRWLPVWPFEKTVQKTTQWYCSASDANARKLTLQQIHDYCSDAAEARIGWAIN